QGVLRRGGLYTGYRGWRTGLICLDARHHEAANPGCRTRCGRSGGRQLARDRIPLSHALALLRLPQSERRMSRLLWKAAPLLRDPPPTWPAWGDPRCPGAAQTFEITTKKYSGA